MRSNYKRIGDYIREVNLRNSDLKTENLLGINIDKFFMPSVANIVGTDMSVYKVVKKGQFGCNRMHVGRDYRLPVALSDKDDPFIVSPAYDVFEIIDPKELLPEYLMMWFSRSEFDRNAWYYTDADVRGGLPWKSFCDMQLPVPHPDKQREIVKEYNTIVNRIHLNSQLIQKLEETAQAIYKKWFVDFEFPDENGQPYKSSGGKMEWCEELGKEVPEEWEIKKISNLGDIKHGYPFMSDEFSETESSLILVSPGNFKIKGGFNFEKNKYYDGKYLENYILKENDLIVNMTDLSRNGDTLGNTALIPNIRFKILLHNQRVGKFELKNSVYSFYLFFITSQKDYKHYILGTATGTTVRHTSPGRIAEFRILLPPEILITKFNLLVQPLINLISINPSQKHNLSSLTELMLSKIATIKK